MSNSVDQRIVQMLFDNAQFEKGVASTLASLKGLEEGLALKGGTSGMEQVQAAADKLSFSNAQHEVGGLAEALGGLRDTATNVFDHITNGVGTLVKGYSLVKGIFSAGIGAMAVQGGWTRASNINKAAFKLNAMGIGWAKVQKQVSAAVDGTAYSLDAAASAAAMFASSGVKIEGAGDQMEQALRAVANVASVSGSSYEEIADIFTKVAAQGKLTSMQVQSLAFKSVDATSILSKHLKMSADDVKKNLSKGLIDFEKFIEIMNKEYGDAAGMANDSFDGAMSNMRSALNRTLADLFASAQISMVPVFNGIRVSINMVNNALKPLVGATWMDGVTEKQGVLLKGFDDIAKAAGRALDWYGGKDDKGKYHSRAFKRYERTFKGIARTIEKPLEEIGKGTESLVKGFLMMGSASREVFRLMGELIAPVLKAFTKVFGGGQFEQATAAFRDGMIHIVHTLAGLHIAKGLIDGIRTAFIVLFGYVRGFGTAAFNAIGGAITAVFDTLVSGGTFLGTLVDMFSALTSSGMEAGQALEETLKPVREMTKDIPVLGPLVNVLTKIPKGIGLIGKALKGEKGSFEKLAKFVNNQGGKIAKIGKDLGDGFRAIGSGLKDFAQNVRDKALEIAPVLLEKLQNFGEKIIPVLAVIPGAIIGFFGAIADAVRQSDLLDFSQWEDFLDLVDVFFDKFANGTVLEKGNFKLLGERIWSALKDALDQTKDKIKDFATHLFDGVFDNVPVPAQNFLKKLSGVFDTVKDIFGKVKDHLLGFRDAIAETFGNAGLSVEPFIEFFKAIGKAIGDFLGGEGDKFDFGKFFEDLKNAAETLKDDVGPKFTGFIGDAVDAIRNNLIPSLEDLQGWLDRIATPFGNLGQIIENVGSKFGSFSLANLFGGGEPTDDNFVGPIFKPEMDTIAETAAEGFDLVQALENIGSLIWNPVSTIKNILSGGFTAFGQSLREFIDSLPEEEIKKFIGFISAMGVDAGMVVGLFNFTRAVGAVSSVVESVNKVMGKVAGVLGEMKQAVSNVGTAIKMHTLLEMAIAIGILAAALIALSFIDVDKLWKVLPILGILTAIIVAMTGFVAYLAGFISVVNGPGGMTSLVKGANFTAMAEIAAAMVPMAAAVAILAFTLGKLAGIDSDSIVRGGNALAQIMIMLGLLVFAVSKAAGPSFAKVGSMMLAMSVSILLMYGAIKLLAKMDNSVFTDGFSKVAAIASIYIALAMLMSLMSSLGPGGGGTKGVAAAMLAMTASLYACVHLIEILAPMDPMTILKGVVTVAALVALIGGLLFFIGKLGAAGKMGKSIRNAVPVLLSLSLVIAVIAGSIAALTMVTAMGGDILGATAAVCASLLSLMAVIWAIGAMGPVSSNAAKALLTVGVSMAVVVGAILLLSQVPWDVLGMGLLAFVAIAGVFIGVLALLGLVASKFAPSLVTLAVSFKIFSTGVRNFGIAFALVAAGILVAVSALALFSTVEPAFTAALTHFFTAMVEMLTSQEDFAANCFHVVAALLSLGVALVVFGAGALIAGAGFALLNMVSGETAENLLAFFKVFSEHKDEFVNGIKDMVLTGVDAMVAVGSELGNRLLEGIGSVLSTIASDPIGFAQKIGAIVFPIMDGLGKAFETIAGLVGGWVDDNIVKPFMDGIAQGFSNFGDWLVLAGVLGPERQEEARQKAAALSESVDEGFDNGEETGKLVEKVNTEVDGAIETMDQKGPELAESAGQMVDDTKATIEEKGKGWNLYEMIGLDEGTLAGGFDSVKSFFGDKGIEIPDELIEKFAGGASGFDAWQMLQDNGNVDMSQFAEIMGSGAVEGADTFELEFDDRMNDVDIMAIVANAADIDEETLKQNFSAAAAAAAQAFSDGFAENMKIDGSGPIDKAVASINASVGSFNDGGSTLGKAATSGFAEGAKKMNTEAKTAVKSAITAVTSEKSSASSGGREVGYNLGAGLKSGLESGSSGLSARAAEIVRNAIAAMKAAAKEKSPSRETIWISEMMMQGLMVGFDNLRSNVADSASSVISDSLKAMSDVSYVSALLDDIDDQPTIRPVLDLTDYEAGINRMRGLNASAPMNSAQWANRIGASSVDSGYYNKSNSMVINLNYGVGTSAADMVNEMAMILQTKNLMEA